MIRGKSLATPSTQRPSLSQPFEVGLLTCHCPGRLIKTCRKGVLVFHSADAFDRDGIPTTPSTMCRFYGFFAPDGHVWIFCQRIPILWESCSSGMRFFLSPYVQGRLLDTPFPQVAGTQKNNESATRGVQVLYSFSVGCGNTRKTTARRTRSSSHLFVICWLLTTVKRELRTALPLRQPQLARSHVSNTSAPQSTYVGMWMESCKSKLPTTLSLGLRRLSDQPPQPRFPAFTSTQRATLAGSTARCSRLNVWPRSSCL